MWTELNKSPPLLHRSYPSGREEVSPLKMGPHGFAMAEFAGEAVETSVPNLILDANKKPHVQKKPSVMKRPGGELEASPLYALMYYKNNHCVGVRQKTGDKRQVVSFGGAKCTKSKDDLYDIGYKVIDMLVQGNSHAECKAWAMKEAGE